jgi:hypothetical protein
MELDFIHVQLYSSQVCQSIVIVASSLLLLRCAADQ